MSQLSPSVISELYAGFHTPITSIDCGEKCAPYHENRVPFCCDTHHVVPTAYAVEWEYLSTHTNLWHLWQDTSKEETARIYSQTPTGHKLIECLGHTHCQREFRSFTCRAFPFFPYIDRAGAFLGISPYWEYAEHCWVISHLERVSSEYRSEFIATYEQLFALDPQEKDMFRFHSIVTRRIFSRRHRAIPLLHRNGYAYKISPSNGRMRRVNVVTMPRFGPYQIAAKLPFPDEIL